MTSRLTCSMKPTRGDYQLTVCTTHFPLMLLPLEIRELVYSYMVGPSFPIEKEDGRISSWFKSDILLASGQIYREARLVLYSQLLSITLTPFARIHRFANSLKGCPFKRCEINVDLETWLVESLETNREMDNWSYICRKTIMQDLQKMPFLEKLHIRTSSFTTRHPGSVDYFDYYHNIMPIVLTDVGPWVSVTLEAYLSVDQAKSFSAKINSFSIDWHHQRAKFARALRAKTARLFITDNVDSRGHVKLRSEIVDLRWEEQRQILGGGAKTVMTENTKKAVRKYEGGDKVDR